MQANLKRKRPGGALPSVVPQAPTIKFTSASHFRDTLRDATTPEATKDALFAFRNQITIPFEEVVTATDPRVKLAHEYLEKSPGAPEIFDAWDLAISANSPLLLPLPLSTLTAIIALLSPLSFFHAALTPILNRILSSTIMRAVSQYISGTRADLVITALRSLGEIVKVADRWAAKVWEALANAGGVNSKVWGKLLGMRRKTPTEGGHGSKMLGASGGGNPLAKPDIRTLSINFLLSCLLSSHLPTKLAILNQSSVVHSMFKPIAEDHPLVVQRLLQGWWEVWFLEKRISKGTKASAFGVDVVGEILKIYETLPSPPSSATGEKEYSSRHLAHHFLLSLLTIPGNGLCFKDKGWYPRNFNMDASLDEFEEAGGDRKNGGGVHNKVLKEVLRTAGGMGLVGEDNQAEELVRRILSSCPELVAGYWSGSGITLDPRLSSKYLISSAHLSTIISLPIPVETFLAPASSSLPSTSTGAQPSYRSIPPPLTAFVENILPSIFPKQFSTKGLVSSHPLVQQTTVVTLARCLTKLQQVFRVFRDIEASLEEGVNGLWTARRKELEREIRKRVPDVATVVGCAVAAARTSAHAQGPEESTRASILTEAILRLLSLYQITLPGLIAEGKFDVGKLLVSGEGGKGKGKGEEEGEIEGWGYAKSDVSGVEALSQLHVLRLLREGGDLAWGSKAGSSPHTYIYHLLALYLSTPHKTTRAYTSILVTRLLSSSVLFEHDPSEVEVWLEAMRTISHDGTPASSALSEAHATLLAFLDDSIRRCLKTPYKYIEATIDFVPAAPIPLGQSTSEPKSKKPSEAPSPLFLTVLEQLKAKIEVKADPLDVSKAIVIGGYIRRVALLMIGKQSDLESALETSNRLDACLGTFEEEEKNEEVGLLKKQLTFLSSAGISTAQQTAKTMSVEAMLATDPMDLDPFHGNIWSNLPPQSPLPRGLSFPFAFLHLPFDLLSDPIKPSQLLQILPPRAPVSLIKRASRLVLHRIHGVLRSQSASATDNAVSEKIGDAISGCVSIVKQLLAKFDGKDVAGFDALKAEIITDPAMKELFVSELLPGSARQALAILVASTLNPASETDRKITSPYLSWATVLLNSIPETRNKWSIAAAPWIRFLDADTLVAIADQILNTIKSSGKLNPESALLLNVIFAALKRHPPSATVHAMAQRSLPILLPLGLVDSVAVLLKTSLLPGFEVASTNRFTPIKDCSVAVDAAAPGSFSPSEASSSKIPMDLKLFVGGISSEKAELITPLLYQASSARQGFSSWLAQNLKGLPALSFPVLAAPVAAFLDVSSAEADYASFPGWKACEEAFPRLLSTFLVVASHSSASMSASSRLVLTESVYILATLSGEEARASISSALSGTLVNPASFTSVVCDLMVRLAKQKLPHLVSIVSAYIDASFEWLVRELSGNEVVAPVVASFMTSFAKLAALQSQGNSLKSHLVEPFFTVALQDRMSSEEALELVRVCTSRTNMKPAVVVRHLQILLANRTFNSLSLSETAAGLRTAVVAVIRALFDMSPATCCQPAHIEPLMSLYRGTMDRTDETILSIFHLFERHRRVSVAPLLTCWSPDGPLAAGSIRRPLDIILALDPNRVLKTCASFPMKRTFDLQPSAADAPKKVNPELYDPLYLMSVFSVVLSQSEPESGNELSGLDWVEILRSNLLGLCVCALSSRMDDMRTFASFLISKACSYIHATPFQEQAQLLYTFHILQHSSRAPEPTSQVPHRSPPLITLFFAHTLRTIGNPSSFLYPLASRFLLQRSHLDTSDVPLLYGLLYSGDEEWKQERTWILRFIRDGMRSAEDWRILQRRRTFSLLASLFQSTHDASSRRTILEAFANMTFNPTGCTSLVKREGFLAWVSIQLGYSTQHQEILLVHPPGGRRGKKVTGGEAEESSDGASSLEIEEVWLRLLENVVHRMGEDDRTRSSSSLHDESQKKPIKAGWRGEILLLLARLIDRSSRPQTLLQAAHVLLRVSLLPQSQPTTPSLSTVHAKLFDRLHALEGSVVASPAGPEDSEGDRQAVEGEELWTSERVLENGGLGPGEAWSGTVRALWMMAIKLGVERPGSAEGVKRELMERLSGRVMCAGGELGGWVRREWVQSRVVENN